MNPGASAGGDLPTGVVTFLFTDIEGSTKLLGRLGDAYAPVQADHQRILRAAIAEGGGVEMRTEGDSFFAVFPSPAGAVLAAAVAQRTLAAHDWSHGTQLQVRMGVHTGEAKLVGGDYLGIDVNRAARIGAAAHGGQVLLSGATRGLVEGDLPDGVALRDLGEHRLKDLERPERLHQLEIAGLPASFPPPRTLEVRSNLPVPMTSFVGRDEEVAALTARLGEGRLVTLTGPGGTGKTRLAIRVASDLARGFADGVCFVDLSPLADPALVPSAIASALELREDPGRPIPEVLGEHLRDAERLLVLDNFEQVLEGASVVGSVLEAAAGVRALVTSRIPLGLSGEEVFAVPPLSVPDVGAAEDPEAVARSEAARLFVERASAVAPAFRLTAENARAVAAICARLDGLPLAIELAASRVPVLSPAEILGLLDDRLGLLAGGPRDAPERQRTLGAAIAWSHDLLDEPRRRLFRRLAVFAGGVTLGAVEAVANPGELGVDTLDALSSLLDVSLLRRAETEGESRYAMLETIRAFARERLHDDAADAAATARSHAAYFLGFAQRAEPHLTAEDQAAWLDRLAREHENLRAAIRWSIEVGEPEVGLRIAAAIWRFWHFRGHLTEGRGLLRELLSMPESAPRTMARVAALWAAGGLAYWHSDFEETRHRYGEALEIATELGDERAIFESRYNAAFVPFAAGELETARRMLEESLALARELGDPGAVAKVTDSVGYVAFLQGDHPAALGFAEESLALATELQNQFQIGETLDTMGQVHRTLGSHEESLSAFRRAIGVKLRSGNVSGVVTTLFMLVGLESDRGRHERAVRLLGAAQAGVEQTEAIAPTAALRMGDPMALASEAIGEEAARRAFEEGRALSLDEAVAEALRDDPRQ